MSSSDAPVRAAGLRTRSGNAMGRTRAAILDAAAACVERDGVRRTTMGGLASSGGVAKATLYNHFRTKEAVLAALVEARAEALALECRALAGEDRPAPGPLAGPGTGLAAALAHAADALAFSPPLRRVAEQEPALLAPLAVPGDGRTWAAVREGVAAVLVAGGAQADPARVELVLRWLLSGLLWPLPGQPARAQAESLTAGLLAGASSPTPPGRGGDVPADVPAGVPGGTGLGWPPAT